MNASTMSYCRAAASFFLLLVAVGSLIAQTSAPPRYELDPSWPKLPLGENWLTGGLGGMCIDDRGHVFALNRQNVALEDLDGAQLAPPVIEFDPDGRVVRGWGDPGLLGDRLHDCHVDLQHNVWIVAAGTGYVQKYSVTGELLLQIGEQGSYDSSDGSSRGRPLNSDRAQFFFPAAIDVDPANGDIYVADGETTGGNQRIAVLDKEGRFLRQWRLSRTDAERDIPALPHCLRLAGDLVYVCDRRADRIQVFDKMGTFVRNIHVPFEPMTSPAGRTSGTRGTAVVVAFSPEPEHALMFVLDQNSNKVVVLDRQTGKRLSSFGGGPGSYPGQFTLPHGIGVDSDGNVYVAEQEGQRIQRFRIVQP
jgi:DNA-binding beta-propeller fold protein YncE